MARKRRQFGFTLVEMLVTLAVVLILISAVARLGQYVKTRASVQLTQSALAVIDTALQQYYADFTAFPFSTDVNSDGISNDVYLKTHLETLLTAAINAVDLMEKDGREVNQSFASSAGLFWFLHRSPNSRSIAEAVTPSLVAVKHPQETQQKLTATVGGTAYDLPRFIDPWGMSLRYTYVPSADTFPKVMSAGPDKEFGTADDILSQ